MNKVVHTPPRKNPVTNNTAMANEVDIVDLQRRLQQQERLIRQLQEQQQHSEQSQGIPTTPSAGLYFIHLLFNQRRVRSCI